jgi:adenylate cyclase
VRGQDWRKLATRQTRVRQAYLASGEKCSTRVRIKDDAAATVTIKSKGAGLRRLEVEYPVSLIDGEALMSLRQSNLIEKVRHEIRWYCHTWEIDVFAGDILA